jgi:predicted DNA-binding protein
VLGTFNFKAPVELWSELKDVSQQTGWSMSRIIREALADWMANNGYR